MGKNNYVKFFTLTVIFLLVFVAAFFIYQKLLKRQPANKSIKTSIVQNVVEMATDTIESVKKEPQPITCSKWHPGHYIIIDPAADKKFYKSGSNWDEKYLESFLSKLGDDFKGAEIPILWRQIETSKDVYDFQYIDIVMKLANKTNKKIFFLITERIYNSIDKPVPDYIYTDKEYGGGAYKYSGNGEVAAVWNTNVQKRFYELIKKLGERYENNSDLEGVIFPESALNISPPPADATPKNYSRYLLERVEVAKKAFPTSIVFQGFNWGDEDVVAKHSVENGVGFHGPDLVPDSERIVGKRRIPAYNYYPLYAGKIPLASDVQSPQLKIKGEWGNFTLDGIYKMGNDTLKLNYIFWSALEWGPNYYNFSSIKTFINSKSGEIKNTACPSMIAPCCEL